MNKKMRTIISVCMMVNMCFASFINNPVLAEETSTEIAEDVGTENTAFTENTVNIYVNPRVTGEENTYKTIAQAISAANKVDKTKNQVIVNIAGGTYDISETLMFSNLNSGTSEYPVIYRAAEGEKVVLNAGKKVTAEKITDKDAAINKIPAQTKQRVYKIDLSDLKQAEFGDITKRGEGFGVTKNSSDYGDILELIYDETMMPRASYPNIGSEIAAGAGGGEKFALVDKEVPIASWDFSTGNCFIQSIASVGYRTVQGQVLSYDAKTGVITTGSGVNVEANGRVRFRNLPEFIDQPGEYCIDFTQKCIYFYPPDEKFNKTAYITTFKDPIIALDGVSNIVFENITIQNSGGKGVLIDNSNNCVLKNCTVKNVTGMGIEVNNSRNVKIQKCNIHDIGMSGIYLDNGGDHKTLTSSGNIVEGCDIYAVGRISPVGMTGINMNDETGTIITNNRIHDVPHSAINIVHCTSCVIEKNEIYNAVNDTYDAGAIYAGASKFKGVGNIYKNNYFHDIRLTDDASGGTVVALYWDDEESGQTSDSNIFADLSFAMLVGGGDWNTIKNNIFYNCNASGTMDSRGESWSTSSRDGALENYVVQFEQEVGLDNTLWDTTYPYVRKFYNYSKENNVAKVQAPDELVLKDNIYIGSADFSIAGRAREHALLIENNVKKEKDYIPFENPSEYNFNYSKEEAPDGVEYIDFSLIGIETKSLSKPQLLGPCDGAENIEGNNIVLSWKNAGGADKYRVQISMYPEFDALVYDEVVKGTRVQLDNLKYGKTYYWRVEPVAASKSEQGGYVSDTFSFKTARTEKKDTTELENMLDSLGTGYKRVTEGNRPGMYQEGAIAELDKVVAEAETILYNNASKMYDVKNVTAKLENAIYKFFDKMNIETVEIEPWLDDEKNWVTGSRNSPFVGNIMHLQGKDSDTIIPNAGYTGAQLTRNQLLKFKTKIDFSGYQMWGLNADDPSGYAWQRNGYSIVAFRYKFEVQRRTVVDGVAVTEILATIPNGENIMTADVWHTVETGVISTTLGPRIIFKVDGKTAVDYIDTSGVKADDLGYFIFSESSGGIGMTIAPSDYVEE